MVCEKYYYSNLKLGITPHHLRDEGNRCSAANYREGRDMLIDRLRDQWICSCGNWVDEEFYWCPDCCEEKFTFIHDVRFLEKARA